MSSVGLKTTSTEEKMNMYENMVEELVADENSRYILDGKFSCHVNFNSLSLMWLFFAFFHVTQNYSRFYYF